MEQEVVQSNLNMLDQINKRIESMLSAIDRSTIRLLQSNDAQFYYNTARSQETNYLLQLYNVQKQIGLLKNSNSNIASIYMYSKRNNTVLSDEFHQSLEDKKAAEWVTAYAEDPSYYIWVTRPLEDENRSSQPNVTLIRHFPAAEKPENRTGMIAVNIQEESLSQMFSDLRFNGNGNVFVIDRQGIILSHSDKTKIGQQFASDLRMEDIGTRNDSGSFHYTNGKQSEWIFYVNSQYTGWKLVYIVDQKQVSDLFLTIRNVLIALAACMIILSIGSVVFLNRKWFYPVELFINSVAQLVDKQSGHTKRPGDKPISTELGSLENRIRNMVASYSDAERQLHENKPMLKLQILFDIFVGHRLRYDLAKTYFDHIGISIYPSNFLVMTAELDNRITHEHVNDVNLYLYAISNVAEELMNVEDQPLCGAAVQINEYQVAILVSFKDNHPDSNERLARSFAQSLQEVVTAYFKQTISIGIGSHYEQFSDIRLSYQESQQWIHYKMVAGRNSIITRHDITDDSNRLLLLYELAEVLLEAVKQVDREKASKAIDSMFGIIADSNIIHQGIVQFALQLIYRAGRASADETIAEYLKASYVRIEQSLEHCETIDDMKQRLAEIMDNIFETMLEKRIARKRTWNAVEEIIAYLDKNYGNTELSLNYLAEKFHLSPGYLSRSFKDFTTINFMDYLIQIRMSAAQTLLNESQLSINQIAEQVGYANVTSFMRSFKKIHGLTPSEYRNALKK
ncbi:helix-turn-helix domain-containing protein [Paenibacillus sp. MBLB4367]|uniref:helix-turn-helix domain-containing protein n=1 Tax=Paenibacillus sp. MBLB4367 TaxID=3384767 RepID=UPI0039083E8E